MARQTSFGDTLRHARERKGMDLSTAARKLRIRPDILRAIEEGDFARMPPRGYTTNMVGAYARLVGLNPSDLTRAYRDESYQFETGRRPMDRGYGYERGTRSSTGRASRRDSLLDPVGGRSSRSRSSVGSSRGGRGQAPQPQYTNLVQGRQAPGIVANLGSMLPLVIVGAIIILLLVLVIMLAFGNRGGQVDDTPTIPISGMSNPAGTDANGGTSADANAPQTPAVEPVAPTSAKFAYTVADGKEAYVEVYMDGKTEQAQMVEGPKTEEFVVTGTLRFVTTYPDNVTATLDGEKVELVSTNNNSIYSFTFDFEEYLAQWRAENGVKAPASDSTATGAGDDSSNAGDGTAGTTSGDDGSDAASSDAGSGGSDAEGSDTASDSDAAGDTSSDGANDDSSGDTGE